LIRAGNGYVLDDSGTTGAVQPTTAGLYNLRVPGPGDPLRVTGSGKDYLITQIGYKDGTFCSAKDERITLSYEGGEVIVAPGFPTPIDCQKSICKLTGTTIISDGTETWHETKTGQKLYLHDIGALAFRRYVTPNVPKPLAVYNVMTSKNVCRQAVNPIRNFANCNSGACNIQSLHEAAISMTAYSDTNSLKEIKAGNTLIASVGIAAGVPLTHDQVTRVAVELKASGYLQPFDYKLAPEILRIVTFSTDQAFERENFSTRANILINQWRDQTLYTDDSKGNRVQWFKHQFYFITLIDNSTTEEKHIYPWLPWNQWQHYGPGGVIQNRINPDRDTTKAKSRVIVDSCDESRDETTYNGLYFYNHETGLKTLARLNHPLSKVEANVEYLQKPESRQKVFIGKSNGKFVPLLRLPGAHGKSQQDVCPNYNHEYQSWFGYNNYIERIHRVTQSKPTGAVWSPDEGMPDGCFDSGVMHSQDAEWIPGLKTHAQPKGWVKCSDTYDRAIRNPVTMYNAETLQQTVISPADTMVPRTVVSGSPFKPFFRCSSPIFLPRADDTIEDSRFLDFMMQMRQGEATRHFNLGIVHALAQNFRPRYGVDQVCPARRIARASSGGLYEDTHAKLHHGLLRVKERALIATSTRGQFTETIQQAKIRLEFHAFEILKLITMVSDAEDVYEILVLKRHNGDATIYRFGCRSAQECHRIYLEVLYIGAKHEHYVPLWPPDDAMRQQQSFTFNTGTDTLIDLGSLQPEGSKDAESQPGGKRPANSNAGAAATKQKRDVNTESSGKKVSKGFLQRVAPRIKTIEDVLRELTVPTIQTEYNSSETNWLLTQAAENGRLIVPYDSPIAKLHQTLGHCNFGDTCETDKYYSKRLGYKRCQNAIVAKFCDSCVVSKMREAKPIDQFQRELSLKGAHFWKVDHIEWTEISIIGHFKYTLIFRDCIRGFIFPYHMKGATKAAISDALKAFKARLLVLFRGIDAVLLPGVVMLRFDSLRAQLSKEVAEVSTELGFALDTSPPKKHNDMAEVEQANDYIRRRTLAVAATTKTGLGHFPLIVDSVCDAANIISSKGRDPPLVKYGFNPDPRKRFPFGVKGYCIVHKEDRATVDAPRAKLCIYGAIDPLSGAHQVVIDDGTRVKIHVTTHFKQTPFTEAEITLMSTRKSDEKSVPTAPIEHTPTVPEMVSINVGRDAEKGVPILASTIFKEKTLLQNKSVQLQDKSILEERVKVLIPQISSTPVTTNQRSTTEQQGKIQKKVVFSLKTPSIHEAYSEEEYPRSGEIKPNITKKQRKDIKSQTAANISGVEPMPLPPSKEATVDPHADLTPGEKSNLGFQGSSNFWKPPTGKRFRKPAQSFSVQTNSQDVPAPSGQIRIQELPNADEYDENFAIFFDIIGDEYSCVAYTTSTGEEPDKTIYRQLQRAIESCFKDRNSVPGQTYELAREKEQKNFTGEQNSNRFLKEMSQEQAEKYDGKIYTLQTLYYAKYQGLQRVKLKCRIVFPGHLMSPENIPTDMFRAATPWFSSVQMHLGVYQFSDPSDPIIVISGDITAAYSYGKTRGTPPVVKFPKDAYLEYYPSGKPKLHTMERGIYGHLRSGAWFGRDFVHWATKDPKGPKLRRGVKDFTVFLGTEEGDNLGVRLIIATDDCLIRGPTSVAKALAKCLDDKFGSLGWVSAHNSWYLGFRVFLSCPHHQECIARMTSIDYNDQLFAETSKRFNQPGADPTKDLSSKTTPSLVGRTITLADREFKATDPGHLHRHRQAVGSLIWISNLRPEIKYAVAISGSLTQHTTTEIHRNLNLHCIRYLHATRTKSSCFRKPEEAKDINRLIGYSDASFLSYPAGKQDRLRSHLGYIIIFNGAIISSRSWKCTRLEAATSTAESEVTAMYHCAKEMVYLQTLLAEWEINTPKPSPLYTDSRSAWSNVLGQTHTSKSKYWLNELITLYTYLEHGLIDPLLVPTKEQRADALTKPAPKAVYDEHFTDLFCDVDDDGIKPPTPLSTLIKDSLSQMETGE
jgi:hypothetical protein